MSKILDELRNWGCDVENALERFVGDEDLYVMCLNTVLMDKSFEGLAEALRGNSIQEAFDYAHTLKGVLANMGLTPMYDITVKIVEPLRVGDSNNLMPIYEELLNAKAVLASIMENA